jgi:CIC family chloride channel protein
MTRRSPASFIGTIKERYGRPLDQLKLLGLAFLVGVFSGLGAVVFRGLIGSFHNLFFFGRLSWSYDANIHTPASPWGPFVVLVPVAGAVVVAFLVKNFAPEAKGTGIPEVMDSTYYHKGFMRPIVVVIKSLASAISIGSGGSVGREGPITQIGATLGSVLGRVLRVPLWQKLTLIGAGTGGGIAATFNTPAGGMIFALELIIHEFSARTLVPVAVSTVTATYVGQVFFGAHPSFVIPVSDISYFPSDNPVVLLVYAGLGVLMGLVSAAFIRAVYAAGDFFDTKVGGSYYRRHILGMFLVGGIMYLLMKTEGHYFIEGVGYSTIQDILSGGMMEVRLLLLLCVLKLLATAITLGSGASGGIFSPVLFLGATLGGSYGILIHQLFPGLSVSPLAFAVAGMAGVAGGATGAAVAAIVMIFEMTVDYTVILPMVITVSLSLGVRKAFSRDSVYALKLVRRGHAMSDVLHRDFQYLKQVKDIMEKRIAVIPLSAATSGLMQTLAEQPSAQYFLAVKDGKAVGLAHRDAAVCPADRTGAVAFADVVNRDFVTVNEIASVFEAISKMRKNGASFALVAKEGDTSAAEEVVGVVTKKELGDSLLQSSDIFAD